MQLSVISASPGAVPVNGVDSPGTNGLTLQPRRGKPAARRQFSSKWAGVLSGQAGNEAGTDKPAVGGQPPDVLQPFVQIAGRTQPVVVGAVGGFKFHDVNRGAGGLQLVINVEVERAEADADAQVGFALQGADQRQHHRPRSHRILAGLDVDIRDGGGPVMNQHLGDFIVHGAGAVERLVVAPHAAVVAILPAIVGDFHHAADENLPAKVPERGLGRLLRAAWTVPHLAPQCPAIQGCIAA